MALREPLAVVSPPPVCRDVELMSLVKEILEYGQPQALSKSYAFMHVKKK